jgi:large subunit ribosomal protein L22
MATEAKSGYRASHRYARISPRKVRFVIDAVRGLPVNDALVALRHMGRRACPMVAKCIKSAMANAQQGGVSDVDGLRVAEVFCNEGPTLKRWSPRAQGRIYQILKRTSHIHVILRAGEESA